MHHQLPIHPKNVQMPLPENPIRYFKSPLYHSPLITSYSTLLRGPNSNGLASLPLNPYS
jgi:hypothetical protein